MSIRSRPESVISQTLDASDADRPQSKRPHAGAIFQQRLPAWQPIVTYHTVKPVFGIMGAIFLIIGISFTVTSSQVHEKVIEYTKCMDTYNNTASCYDADINSKCVCEMMFNLTKPMKGEVFMYYGLRNFHQNHRKYARSRSDEQLRGDISVNGSSCYPYQFDNETFGPYAPCGLIANSIFNDTFTLYKISNSDIVAINSTTKDIAWPSDHGYKFRNPEGATLQQAFAGTVKPTNWEKSPWQLDEKNEDNNGFLHEPFIVWMRVAAFPTFRKVYARIDSDDNTAISGSGLPSGQYKLIIDYKYHLRASKSEKFFVLTTTSWLGAKNPFLGIMYLVAGIIMVSLALVFVFLEWLSKN